MLRRRTANQTRALVDRAIADARIPSTERGSAWDLSADERATSGVPERHSSPVGGGGHVCRAIPPTFIVLTHVWHRYCHCGAIGGETRRLLGVVY